MFLEKGRNSSDFTQLEENPSRQLDTYTALCIMYRKHLFLYAGFGNHNVCKVKLYTEYQIV
jgi:hypothetical protein